MIFIILTNEFLLFLDQSINIIIKYNLLTK